MAWLAEDRTEDYCRFCRHYPGVPIGSLTVKQFQDMLYWAEVWDATQVRAMSDGKASLNQPDKTVQMKLSDILGIA